MVLNRRFNTNIQNKNIGKSLIVFLIGLNHGKSWDLLYQMMGILHIIITDGFTLNIFARHIFTM